MRLPAPTYPAAALLARFAWLNLPVPTYLPPRGSPRFVLPGVFFNYRLPFTVFFPFTLVREHVSTLPPATVSLWLPPRLVPMPYLRCHTCLRSYRYLVPRLTCLPVCPHPAHARVDCNTVPGRLHLITHYVLYLVIVRYRGYRCCQLPHLERFQTTLPAVWVP